MGFGFAGKWSVWNTRHICHPFHGFPETYLVANPTFRQRLYVGLQLFRPLRGLLNKSATVRTTRVRHSADGNDRCADRI